MIIKASPTICDLSLFMAWKLQSYIRLMGWWEMVILLPDYDMNEQSRSLTIQKYLNTMQRSARVIFSISRREWEFLLLNLAHRDETENFWHLISGFETRPRKNLLQSRASRRDRDLFSSFSGFETRTRIPLMWSRFLRREREFWEVKNIYNAQLYIYFLFSHFDVTQSFSPSPYVVIFLTLAINALK